MGSHNIVATYGGDGGNNGSTSSALTQTVNKATSAAALASSANPSVVGSSVTFTATVDWHGADRQRGLHRWWQCDFRLQRGGAAGWHGEQQDGDVQQREPRRG